MTEQREANHGWFARWRADRRIERQEAREREHVAQERLARLLREYPLGADQQSDARTQTRSSGRSSVSSWPAGGGFWGEGGSGFWGDGGGGFWGDGGGGFWGDGGSGFWGDGGGGSWGGGGGDGGGC